MEKKDSTIKKVGRSFLSMFKRLMFGERTVKNVLEEEALRTPGKTILINLIHNKLAIAGIIGFIAITIFSFGGSMLFPISKTYVEYTNANLPPGINYTKYPKNQLKDKNIVKIVSGVSFSVALDDKGELYIWGSECNIQMRNVSDYIMKIPDDIKNANIVDIEAGAAHVIALDDKGNFYGWGYYGHGQTILDADVKRMIDKPGVSIVKMGAMRQWSAILTSEGRLYLWGGRQSITVLTVPAEYQGRIVDFKTGDNNMVLLLDDGTLAVIGQAGNEFYENMPSYLADGSVNIVMIAASNRNVLAMDDQGNLHTWGSMENRLDVIPEYTGKAIHIEAGYKNFVVVTDDGSVVTWGANELKQLNMPKNLSGTEVVFGDYFQFYAIDGGGKIIGSWGNNGYLWGTDHVGRDIFTRIMHGGKISLTVGALAVLVSTVIAIIVGLVAGYFGGWVDHLLMRVTDIISALPFLPIAITLSYALGYRISNEQRVYMIMVILGVLGWVGLARLIRAQLLLEREKDFVLAARSLGIKQRHIMIRHILPNVFNFVIVSVTLGYASYMLSEAGLSFLGFGVKEPTPSWGNMLTSAQETVVIQYYWWRWIIPALFVVIAALSINVFSDALREAMDPKSNER